MDETSEPALNQLATGWLFRWPAAFRARDVSRYRVRSRSEKALSEVASSDHQQGAQLIETGPGRNFSGGSAHRRQ
jgi:anti-sigma factor RsiW